MSLDQDSASGCKKHPSQKTDGICAICLTERLHHLLHKHSSPPLMKDTIGTVSSLLEMETRAPSLPRSKSVAFVERTAYHLPWRSTSLREKERLDASTMLVSVKANKDDLDSNNTSSIKGYCLLRSMSTNPVERGGSILHKEFIQSPGNLKKSSISRSELTGHKSNELDLLRRLSSISNQNSNDEGCISGMNRKELDLSGNSKINNRRTFRQQKVASQFCRGQNVRAWSRSIWTPFWFLKPSTERKKGQTKHGIAT